MSRHIRAAAALAMALTLGGCTSNSTGASGSVGVVASPASIATASASVAATGTPAPTASPTPLSGGGEPSGSAAASPVAIDPCALLKDSEASAINGVAYGPGAVHSLSGGAVECVWSSGASGSITVQVAVASDNDSARARYTAALTDVQKAGSVTQVPGFADMAVIGRVPPSVVSTGGIYVLDGATFFDVVYLLGTIPSDAQLKFAATLVLGSLP